MFPKHVLDLNQFFLFSVLVLGTYLYFCDDKTEILTIKKGKKLSVLTKVFLISLFYFHIKYWT